MRTVILLVLTFLDACVKHGADEEIRTFAAELKKELETKYPL